MLKPPTQSRKSLTIVLPITYELNKSFLLLKYQNYIVITVNKT